MEVLDIHVPSIQLTLNGITRGYNNRRRNPQDPKQNEEKMLQKRCNQKMSHLSINMPYGVDCFSQSCCRWQLHKTVTEIIEEYHGLSHVDQHTYVLTHLC